MRNFAVGFAVGLGVGGGCAYFYLVKTREQAPSIHSPVSPLGRQDDASRFRFHPALKFGAPQTETLRFFDGFVACFDSKTRNPCWVLEHITKESTSGDADRSRSDFFEDPGLEPRFRNQLSDFKGSGYDRGHLAPAANHKGSQKAMADTFVMSNISPQVGKGFNRDYWARFEKFVKDLTKKCDSVYVATGPLYLPRNFNGKWVMDHPLLGEPPRLISVPTHFYKVVLAESTNPQKVAVGAFVMPNAPIEPMTPLSAFVVPLEALEDVVGGKFFPQYVDNSRRELLDRSALGWQTSGRQQMKALERSTLNDSTAALAPQGSSQLVPSGGEGGTLHLCDHVACRLPAEEFWKKGGSAG